MREKGRLDHHLVDMAWVVKLNAAARQNSPAGSPGVCAASNKRRAKACAVALSASRGNLPPRTSEITLPLPAGT